MENRLSKYLKKNNDIDPFERALISRVITQNPISNDEFICSKESELYLIGMPGLLGTLLITKYYGENIKKHFNSKMIEKFISKASKGPDYSSLIQLLPSSCLTIPVGEMGLYGALFKLKDMTGCGFEVDLNKISLMQELIEITDYLDINPYKLISCNCAIIICNQPDIELPELIHIGNLRSDNEMRIIIDSEFSLLNRPTIDEYLKYLNRNDND